MRLYTVAEARAALPSVIPVLTAARDAFVRLRAIRAAAAAKPAGPSADGHALHDPGQMTAALDEPEALGEKLRASIATLTELGIELKDPARGLIDFYHEREGEVVYLCYLLGEPDIAFWHTLRGGFAGRRPL